MLYPEVLPPWYHGVDLMAEGLLDIKEASKFIAVGRSKLYAAMDSLELPYCKIGKSRLIPKVALKIYAEKG